MFYRTFLTFIKTVASAIAYRRKKTRMTCERAGFGRFYSILIASNLLFNIYTLLLFGVAIVTIYVFRISSQKAAADLKT